MKHKISIAALVVLLGTCAFAQLVPSHTPAALGQSNPAPQAAGNPVVKVNGVVLTDRDLLREMYTIFPYAQQHGGGFPKEMESGIRDGALKMIVFEELVYQEAKRRNLLVPPERMRKAEADFRQQFTDTNDYQKFLQMECGGSRQVLRAKITRSLLIDQLLKAEVDRKSVVPLADLKAYYDKNPQRFAYPESFSIQTISIIPPAKATPDQLKDARKRAEDALKQAQATKTPEEFGLLAEKISEDDYRVTMGNHGWVDRAKLPPNMLQAALAMQPGQVSDLLQVEQIYVVFRMNHHVMPGRKKFDDVKDDLRKELQKEKTNQIRAALAKKLRVNAKVEVL
jgi:parvulin-like peptidyl-prolyl isomerase